jgi:hypothetical protein
VKSAPDVLKIGAEKQKAPFAKGAFCFNRQHHDWPDFTPPRRPEIAPPLTPGGRWVSEAVRESFRKEMRDIRKGELHLIGVKY